MRAKLCISLEYKVTGIECEVASFDMEERKLVAEIKRTAKTGNDSNEVVQIWLQITNLQGSSAQFRDVATHTHVIDLEGITSHVQHSSILNKVCIFAEIKSRGI
ncbi:hypothetical protein OROGR_010376 [Orobanche gracilis]